ncbi:MAG: hypothetical protein JW776_12570 [Candidatus Lokiarchaeota archaeon]|nr:hypothetical protein [Candidatus Lokiarchaeota archaeon]
MVFRETILSAVPVEKIIAYFQKNCDLISPNTKFIFKSQINIEILASRSSELVPRIKHTPIVFSGPKELVKNLIAEFRAHFLTVGG